MSDSILVELPAEVRQYVAAVDDATEQEVRLHRARALAAEHQRITMLEVPRQRLDKLAALGALVLEAVRKALA